jgi:hypothetical protein
MNKTANPLISNGLKETVQNAAEALEGVLSLLSESQDPRHQRMFMMLNPISHALDYVANAKNSQ